MINRNNLLLPYFWINVQDTDDRTPVCWNLQILQNNKHILTHKIDFWQL
jgi:hypothetical protein